MFYGAYFLFMTATALQSTTFTQYSVLSQIFVLMRYASFGIAGIKISLDLYREWQFKKERGIKFAQAASVRRCGIYAVLFLVLGIVSVRTGDRTLLFVGALLLASRGIKFDDIAKKSFWMQCGLMVVVVVCSSFNIIPDLLFKREDIPIRHALGYTYPSVMVTSCLFLFLLYVWNKNECLSDQEFLTVEIFNLLIYKLTDSRTGFLTLGGVALILWGVGKKWFSHQLCGLWERCRGRIQKVVINIYDYLALYLAAALLLLCASMPLKITQIMNRLLTDRIRLAANAIQNYGIHLFGNNIEWIGFGGSTDTDSLLASYNFVDSSYGYILVNYGLIIFVLALFLIVISSKYVRKTESKIRSFIFCVITLYCFIEPRLLEIHVNNFLFLSVPAVITYKKYYKKLFRRTEERAGRS